MFKERPEGYPENQPSDQEEKEKMRERVDNLAKTDNEYEDSVYTLAENEEKYREKIRAKLKKLGVLVPEEEIGDWVADEYSTKDLERMEAEKEKWTDELTGLRNKNAYIEDVPKRLSAEKRREREKGQRSDCSLLVIDCDYFRKVNKHGHGAGDEALKQMAEILKETIRLSDTAYRFGGEEFVIFLPETDSLHAAEAAERIRKKIEESNIDITDTKGKKIALKITVSVGCVGTDQLKTWDKYDADTADEFLEDMFHAADASVIVSKKNGRDQVTLYDEDLSLE